MLKKLGAAALMFIGAIAAPRAEIGDIAVAQQFGVSFLPLMIMERDGLIESHARNAGIDKLKVNWTRFSGPSAINDGLISGQVHFAAIGAPSMITLWSKTKGNIGVRGVSAMTTYPLYLVTRNPDVKTLKDLSAKDKIAVPSVKISTQAIMLQMAAQDIFGDGNHGKFDDFTISLSHPDAVLALMNNTAGVNAHFGTSPFYEAEIKIPGVRLLTTNYEILGGRATAVVIAAPGRFRDANPKVYGAFLAGLKQAIEIINKDKRAAAQAYLALAKDTKNTVDDIFAIINDKDYAYTLSPEKVFKTAGFMAKIGSVKDKPESWKDLFFPEIHALPGD
jgi:sulfonate transport system substrate-binding protein